MKRPCLRCGRLIASGSTCRRCESRRKRVTPGRTGAAKFRRAVLATTGGVCAGCDRGGRKLTAHHLVGLRDGGSNDPSNGVALCGSCHAKVEAAVRRNELG